MLDELELEPQYQDKKMDSIKSESLTEENIEEGVMNTLDEPITETIVYFSNLFKYSHLVFYKR